MRILIALCIVLGIIARISTENDQAQATQIVYVYQNQPQQGEDNFSPIPITNFSGFGWPILDQRRRVSSGFGPRFWNKKTRTYGDKLHPAIDIAMPVGTPIYAPADGIVRHVMAPAKDGRCGNGYIIWHKWSDWSAQSAEIQTRYCHMDQLYVKKNERVYKGRTILGTVGMTGIHNTGPHLHFAIEFNGHAGAVNPLQYLPKK